MTSVHQTSNASHVILPRLLRFRDAPQYLGMDRNKFNTEVRPYLTEIPLGKQAVAFDRLEIDAWADDYISRNGRPGRSTGDLLWDEKLHRASKGVRVYGTSTSSSVDGVFAKALKQLNSLKPNDTSHT